eukprot:Rhum_TRINITY_DN277_c1_g1::Rhum_TRINITY_DN277_c1_g1_i1::g.1009::m.1009
MKKQLACLFGLAAALGLLKSLSLQGSISDDTRYLHHHVSEHSDHLSCVRNPALCTHTHDEGSVYRGSRGDGGGLSHLPSDPAAAAHGNEPPAVSQRANSDDVWAPLGRPSVDDLSKPAVCPDKYLTVNTHTWGRHHNQLQSVMHALVLARLTGRTFVVGHFRHAKRWYDVRDFYSFEAIAKRFCVVDHAEAARRLRGETNIACLGQTIDDTPFGKAIGGKKCRHGSFPKAFENARFKEFVARGVEALGHADVRGAKIVNLSGQLAFYARPGLRLMGVAYGLLQPSPEVAAEVRRFQREAFGVHASDADSASEYVAIHLRYREGTCLAELERDFAASFHITPELLASLREQCTVNYAYVTRTLRAALGDADAAIPGVEPNRFHHPAFLASDHQNKSAEEDFTSRGALLYSGKFGTQEIGGLSGLATDYFLLRGGMVFVGNTASSVSQNSCFGRLLDRPWSKACAGWNYTLLTEMVTTAVGDMVPPHA